MAAKNAATQRKQDLWISEYATNGRSQGAATAAIKVSRQTVARWHKDADFKAALLAKLNELEAKNEGDFSELARAARRVLQNSLYAEDEAVRLRAAIEIERAANPHLFDSGVRRERAKVGQEPEKERSYVWEDEPDPERYTTTQPAAQAGTEG